MEDQSLKAAANDTKSNIEALSAITLATRDMARAVPFYQALGFPLTAGGANHAFTSFALGCSFLNLIAEMRGPINWWGRVIIHVSDVDEMYRKAVGAGLAPQFAPRDAPWGERYFHIADPDGHELSFARPLDQERPILFVVPAKTGTRFDPMPRR
jgi:catechol 2,3-dioxygenase-like lactoylglutathione lyase family enzyme